MSFIAGLCATKKVPETDIYMQPDTIYFKVKAVTSSLLLPFVRNSGG